MKKMKLNFTLLFSAIVAANCQFEFNASSPLPPTIMARNANLTKPRLKIPHVTDYADYFTLAATLGIQMALEGIAKVSPYLQDFELEVEVYDTFCSDELIVGYSVSLMEQRIGSDQLLPVHMALGCSGPGQTLVGEIVHHYNFTAIANLDAVTPSFHDRSRFENFFTLGESLESIHAPLLTFFKKQGWSKVAIIGEDHQYYIPFAEVLIEKIKKADLELLVYERLPYYLSYDESGFRRAMESLVAADARIIVFHGDSGNAAFCWLYRYKLYGPNYAIFVLRYSETNRADIAIPDYISSWCKVEMIREIMNTTFLFGEANRADIFKDEPDQTGMTWQAFEDDVRSRVDDVDNVVFIYETSKFYYYDPMLFTGLMLNEAERLLREQNDSLANWSVGSDNFRQNGQYIADLMADAVTNIRVIGMRGTYEFYKNTTLNTGGFTPLSIFQVFTFPESIDVKSVEVISYESWRPSDERFHTLKNEIVWNSLDGKPPFDRVIVKRIDVKSLNKEGSITLSVISAVAIVTLVGLSIFKRSNQTIPNLLLVFGLIIADSHCFLLLLRDVEPIFLHCTIIAVLIMVGVSTCFLAILAILEIEAKKFEADLKRRQNKAAVNGKIQIIITKFERFSTGFLQLILFLIGFLFIISEPIESIGSEATADMTFGKREVELSTRQKCQLNFDIFPIVVICIDIAMVICIVLKSFVTTYKIQLLQKQIKKQKKSNFRVGTVPAPSQQDSSNLLVVMVTMVIASALIIALMADQALYITAVSTNLLAVAIIVKMILTPNK